MSVEFKGRSSYKFYHKYPRHSIPMDLKHTSMKYRGNFYVNCGHELWIDLKRFLNGKIGWNVNDAFREYMYQVKKSKHYHKEFCYKQLFFKRLSDHYKFEIYLDEDNILRRHSKPNERHYTHNDYNKKHFDLSHTIGNIGYLGEFYNVDNELIPVYIMYKPMAEALYPEIEGYYHSMQSVWWCTKMPKDLDKYKTLYKPVRLLYLGAECNVAGSLIKNRGVTWRATKSLKDELFKYIFLTKTINKDGKNK